MYEHKDSAETNMPVYFIVIAYISLIEGYIRFPRNWNSETSISKLTISRSKRCNSEITYIDRVMSRTVIHSDLHHN